jgi:PAS domain S-box-containing protein
MSERKRLYLLISVMTGVSLLVGGIAICVLYRAAMDEERDRLMESAQSQARLIEAVARFDAVQSTDFPNGSEAATISQIVDAHKHFKWVGETGEFTVARREGEQIVFLLSHRHYDLKNVKPVQWDSRLAEPMRLALSGKSGTIVAIDYRGEKVLAAHEPVAELDLGIVAKINLAEVRAPFVRAGFLGIASAVVVVFAASLLFLRISNPMIRQIQEKNARLDAILETAADGIITFDAQGVIESFNQAAERMFGHAEEDVVGFHLGMLTATSCEDEHQDSLAIHPRTDQSETIGTVREVVGMRKDGSTFPMDLAISEVRVAGHAFFTGIVRDITDRKRAEQNARLAAIGQMLSTVAHESRNSLQRIQAGLDMLRLDLEGNPDLIEQLNRIQKADDALTKLYEELREYAAPITLDLKTCDLQEIWRLAWANLGHRRQGRKIELREQTDGLDLHCSIDEFRIEQVFRNLMENSLAACADPATIDISCHDTLHNGARAVCVSFRDNGPGLTDEQIDRLFDAFFTTKPKGTGLGMAIAQRIIEAHQGVISVGNVDHGGAEFVIKLPRE